MKAQKNLFVNTSFFLMCLIAVPVVLSWVSSLVFGLKVMHVVSGSMEPEFYQGDVIVVSTRYNSVTVGDVIAFRASWLDNKVVTHRVVGIEGDSESDPVLGGKTLTVPHSKQALIYTRGDNNVAQDPLPTSLDYIEGEVVSVLPYVGWILHRGSVWAIATFSTFFLLLGVFLPRYRGKSDTNHKDSELGAFSAKPVESPHSRQENVEPSGVSLSDFIV